MAITKIPAAGFTGNNFRNIIINGDMSIAQRGTSSSGISSTGYYTVDRFNFVDSNLGTFTMSQDTDVPTGQGFSKSLKVDCTTADASPAGADYLFLQTKFEGQNLQYIKKGTSSAESLTLSFWVKSVKTGTYIVQIEDVDNSSRFISKSYTIDSASTWEKKTITFAGDTTGTLAYDNSSSLELNFWLGAGTDRTSGTLQTSWGSYTASNVAVGQVNFADSTSNNFLITGVQLEVGSAASDFEFLPYDVNLRRCMRYCQVLVNGDVNNYMCLGFAQSANLANILFPFYVEPRVPATGITVQNVNGFGATTVASGGRGSAASFGQSSIYAAHWQLTTDTGSFVAGYPLFLYNYNTGLDAKIIFTGMEL